MVAVALAGVVSSPRAELGCWWLSAAPATRSAGCCWRTLSPRDHRLRAGLCGLRHAGAARGAARPEWAVLWDQSSWPLLFGVLIAIAFVFPDGRLPSPRWRRVAFGAAAAFAAFLVLSLFDPEPFEAPYESVDRPLPGLPECSGCSGRSPSSAWSPACLPASRPCACASGARAGSSGCSSSGSPYTAVLVPATLLVCLAGTLAADGVERRDVFNALFFFMLGAIPTSIGVAVLRYRLYDIDRVINRTLVYGVLTVLLAAAYAATTLLLGTALGSGSAWPTAGGDAARGGRVPPAARGGSRTQWTAASAALATTRGAGSPIPRGPARRTRRARGGRAAAPRGALRPAARAALLPARERALRRCAWLPGRRPPDDGRAADPGHARRSSARDGAPQPDRRGDRPGLLDEVVEAAGLAIEIARLRVELRRQLDEVEASRARIVSAGYEERRRLERDLHDGAQQRLISIGLALRHAQHELAVSPSRRASRSTARSTEIAVAIEELRELARGVRPAQLDAGLTPRSQRARRPRPVARRGQGRAGSASRRRSRRRRTSSRAKG